MAQQESEDKSASPDEGELQLPVIVANHHILFLDKKASSSGSVKPPMADELLDHYTAEQLRMHWLGLGLGQRSVSFMPKPYNPDAKPEDADPVVKDGLLLSNVYNRIIRTAFYTLQKELDGILPENTPSGKILADGKKAVLDYERHMSKFAFHQCTYVLDSYIRKASKYMSRVKSEADKLTSTDEEGGKALARKYLIDVFHMIKTAMVLLHPLAPEGTQMICDYMQLDSSIWSWDKIFNTLNDILGEDHKLRFLEPRVDFFKKHPSQLRTEG
jgi:methionyl-tRNA synthetase